MLLRPYIIVSIMLQKDFISDYSLEILGTSPELCIIWAIGSCLDAGKSCFASSRGSFRPAFSLWVFDTQICPAFPWYYACLIWTAAEDEKWKGEYAINMSTILNTVTNQLFFQALTIDIGWRERSLTGRPLGEPISGWLGMQDPALDNSSTSSALIYGWKFICENLAPKIPS